MGLSVIDFQKLCKATNNHSHYSSSHSVTLPNCAISKLRFKLPLVVDTYLIVIVKLGKGAMAENG